MLTITILFQVYYIKIASKVYAKVYANKNFCVHFCVHVIIELWTSAQMLKCRFLKEEREGSGI